MSGPHRRRRHLSLIVLLSSLAGGCALEPVERDVSSFAPLIGADTRELSNTSPEEIRRLRLVATNLVAALVQIPEARPAVATLQVRRPASAFGNLVVRALEDAGYGLQRVDADQGRNNVTYSQRFARTESGPVEDFTLSVGRIALSREYTRQGDNIYPASLMTLAGINPTDDIDLHDAIFTEQGDIGTAYISGTRMRDGAATGADVQTIDVRPDDPRPIEKRSASEHVLASARRHYSERASMRGIPDLHRYTRQGRLVLLLDNASTLYLGRENKQLVRELVKRVGKADLVVVKACHDANGRNEGANAQAVRVEEEVVAYGVAADSVRIAPCAGASYRHVMSDDRVTPVEVVHFRRD